MGIQREMSQRVTEKRVRNLKQRGDSEGEVIGGDREGSEKLEAEGGFRGGSQRG